MDNKPSSESVHGDTDILECDLVGCRKVILKPAPNQRFCNDKHRAQYHTQARMIGEKKLKSKGMHYASLKSEGVQRVLKYLSDCQWHTSIEIIMATRLAGWHQNISSLRHHGFNIKKEFWKRIDGMQVYRYRLIKH